MLHYISYDKIENKEEDSKLEVDISSLGLSEIDRKLISSVQSVCTWNDFPSHNIESEDLAAVISSNANNQRLDSNSKLIPESELEDLI